MSEDKRKKFADLNIHGIESGSEFEHSRINVDEDEDTQRDLAKMAEIEERNAKMERIRLDKEKVVGSEVKKTVRDGVQILYIMCGQNQRSTEKLRNIGKRKKKSRRIYLI